MPSYEIDDKDIGITQYSWEGFEREPVVYHPRVYIGVLVMLFAIIIYAIFTNNPIMAITFILVGVVGYLYFTKENELIEFSLTSEGIVTNTNFYPYSDLKSFWIFYEPDEGIKTISLQMQSGLVPHIQVPLQDEDPLVVRKILLKYIPEKKHDLSFIDRMSQFF